MANDDLVAAIAKLSPAEREKLLKRAKRAKAPVADAPPPKPARGGPKISPDVLARWHAKGHDEYGRRTGGMQWEFCAPDSDPLAEFDDG